MKNTKTRWSLIIGFACFSIYLSLPLFSQNFPVQGVVRDKDGEKPLANIKIIFLNLRNGMEFSCKSNKKGVYMRAGIPDDCTR